MGSQRSRYSGFQESGALFGSPYKKDPSGLESILGPLIYESLPIDIASWVHTKPLADNDGQPPPLGIQQTPKKQNMVHAGVRYREESPHHVVDIFRSVNSKCVTE